MRFLLLVLTGSLLLAAENLEALFERATYDPAAVVPLVEAVADALPHLSADEAVRTADRLRPYTQQLFFGGEEVPGMAKLGLIQYSVRSGDTFGKIAKRYGLGVGHVQQLNPYAESSRLQVGQQLKLLDARKRPLRCYVWKSQFRLLLMQPFAYKQGLCLLASYKVGIGTADRSTPEGATHISDMVRKPSWTDPDTGEVFAPDDPGNVLGGYWIRLDPGPEGIFKGIGIHGYTGAPSSNWIERPGSRGCLRMLPEDIDQLYGVLTVGTPIAIMP